LIGSPDQVVEKIVNYHAAYGHQVLSISVDGLSHSEQLEQLERFAGEVAPVLRRELPSSVWDNAPILTQQPATPTQSAPPAISPIFQV